MKKIITLCFLMALVCVKGWGQTTINMSSIPQTTCSANYYDPGGSAGNYANGSNITQIITPGTVGNAVKVVFSAFNTESTFDFLYIYNGNSVTPASLIGKYSGTTSPGAITSTAANGSLTFVFTSDGNTVASGWVASLSCVTQTAISMTTGTPFSTCSATYYDPQGTNNYLNNTDITQTITPSTAGAKLQAAFSSFSTEATFDFLYIYNGNTTSATLIGKYSGTQLQGLTITSTATDGSLTFRFTSDGNTVSTGWVAALSCTTPALTYQDSWLSMSTGASTWCAGETRSVSVTVKNTGTATWVSGSTGVNFSYYWSNQSRDANSRILPFTGAGLAPGQQQTITFPVTAPSAGTYTLNFDLVKEGSCWFADNVSGCSGPGNIVYPSASQTIGALPTVATAAATSVTINSATVPGTITAGCTVITGYGIEYSTTNNFANGTGTAVAGSNLLGSNYTVNLTGLSQGTTYYCHAFVNYSGGTSYSAQGSFITLTPTLSASALAAFGNVCTGTTAGPNSFTITGTNLTAVNIAVGPLTGYTFSTTSTGTYSASLSLTHAAGSYSQAIYVKFTPVATVSYNGNIPISGGGATTINVTASGTGVNSPPIATSGSASSITSNSATVAGSLAAGCSATTAYGIEYSTSASALGVNGGTTATKAAGGTLTSGNFTSALGSLTSNTTYYYDAYATSSGGNTYGSQGSFSTLCGTVASFPFTETFETSSATSNCWSNVYVSGTQNWGYTYGSYGGDVSAPHTGSYDASFDDLFYTTAVTKLVSPVLNLSGLSATGARVRFWYQNPYTFDFFDDYHDQLKVYYRTTSTGAWTLIPNAVYKNDIGSWTQVSLILPSISSTYQIAFEGSVDPDFSGYVQSGDLAIDDVTIEAIPPPPANDNCSGAIALTVNSTCSNTSGTTVNATLSQAAATCSGSTGVADDDVWYKFIANNTTTTVTVSTVSSTLDPVIQAFSGTCGSLTSITCIDVNGSGSGESLSLSGLTVGATYYVRVYGYGLDISTQGTFNICITGTCLAPTAYSVTGGGAYCSGGTGVAVGLSNSQIGFSYQLRNGGTNTGSPVTGTGSAISFGNQTAAGTYTVVATNTGSSGCSTTMTGSATVSINPNVVAGTISGITPLCINGTATYTSNGTTGGTWSSTVTGVATVNASTGAVTAVGAGTTNITYTVSSGCGSPVNTFKTLTVSPNATAGTVSGTTPLCIGSTTTYTISGNSSPGTWSSTNTGVATVNASTGVVTAVAAGTTSITYTVSTGCNNPVNALKTLTVSPDANAGTVSGINPLCIGTTATYTSSGDAGGAWSSTNPAVATVNASGVVTAAGAGTSDITYTVSSGCNNPVSAFKTVTVSPNATAGTISGTSPLCIGITSTYNSSGNTGGTWSSNNTSVATVNASTGAVTAVAAGTTNITYTVSAGCNNPVSASKILTVSPNANAGTVSGATPLCSGTAATYTSNGNTGGVWTSTNTAVATVNASTGAVTAVSAGTTNITYTVSAGCNAPAISFQSLTVNQTPVASIETPSYTACDGSAPGITFSGTANAAITYTITLQGGGNISTTPVFIPANGDNVIVPAQSGQGIYTYTITGVSTGNSCTGTITNPATTVTIKPTPVVASITGPDLIAIGATVTYTDATTGGNWTSTYPGIASVVSQNNTISRARVNGVSVGTSTITYTTAANSFGCTNTAELTIQVYDGTLTRYRTTSSGKFSEVGWQKTEDNGNTWTISSAPNGNNTNIEIRDNVTLNVDYNGSENASFRITGMGAVDGILKIAPNHIFSSLGGVDFNGKSVIVQSDVTGSGAIGQMTNTINNAGNVTVERYTSAGDNTLGRRAWRLVTSPITDKTIHQTWQEGHTYINGSTENVAEPDSGTLITGEGLNTTDAKARGFDYIGGGNHTSIKYYNTTVNPGGTWDQLLTNNIATGTDVPVRDQQAYMLFVRGDRTIHTTTGKSTTTLRATGMLNQAPLTITVDHTKNFTLVGNPYAAPLNFEAIYNGSISSKFVIWNSSQSELGAYNTVIRNAANDYIVVPFGGLQTNDNNARFIQSGSAFFVSSSSTTTDGSLTIDESAKNLLATDGVGTFREVPQADKKLWVNLNLKNSDSSITVADGVLARFDASYADNIDADDTKKQSNFNENLGIFSKNTNLMVEARPDVRKTDTVQLKLWYVTKRNYQFQMKADNFGSAAGLHAYLEDNYLQTKQEISLAGDFTTVNFAVTSDSLSWKSDRFRIVFQNNAVILPVTLTNVKATLQNSGVTVSWTVSNEVNMKGYTVERSTDGGGTYTAVATQAAKNGTGTIVTSYAAFDAQPKTGDNLYRIRIEAKDGVITYSSVVSITIGATGNIEIAVYPNPVRDGKVNLQMTNLAAGTYLASVYSEGGQSVYQRKIVISQSSTTQSEDMKLGKALAQGSYQLRITDSKGNRVKETKLIIGR